MGCRGQTAFSIAVEAQGGCFRIWMSPRELGRCWVRPPSLYARMAASHWIAVCLVGAVLLLSLPSVEAQFSFGNGQECVPLGADVCVACEDYNIMVVCDSVGNCVENFYQGGGQCAGAVTLSLPVENGGCQPRNLCIVVLDRSYMLYAVLAYLPFVFTGILGCICTFTGCLCHKR